MRLVSKYQNELYSLALGLTYDQKNARKFVIKAFEKVLGSYYDDSNETKLKLYKNLLGSIGVFSIKKKQCKDKSIAGFVKKKLGLFDKKVFALKYENGLTVGDICYILNEKPLKIKKALFKSAMLVADILEDKEDEM